MRSCCADDFQGYAPLDLRSEEGSASEAQAVGAPVASSGAVQTVTASSIGGRFLPAGSGSGPQQAAPAGQTVMNCLGTMAAEVDVLDEEDGAPAGGGGGMLMGSYGFHNLDADAVRNCPWHRCIDRISCIATGCMRAPPADCPHSLYIPREHLRAFTASLQNSRWSNCV